MLYNDIVYAVDGPIGIITLNAPQYRNAQSYRMDSFGDYVAMMNVLADEMRVEGRRRLMTVDLAVKGRKGERFGPKPKA
jgi:hypothetical protein